MRADGRTECLTGPGKTAQPCSWRQQITEAQGPKFPASFYKGIKIPLSKELRSCFSEFCRPDIRWPFSTLVKAEMALFQYFPSVQTSLERPSTQTCPPPPHDSCLFSPFIIKMLLVIHSIFQNMQVTLLLMEPGYTIWRASIWSKIECLLFKMSFQWSWRTLEVKNSFFSLRKNVPRLWETGTRGFALWCFLPRYWVAVERNRGAVLSA